MSKIDYLFEEPIASELEQKREEARRKWLITYDCYGARVKDDRVYCSKGHDFRSKYHSTKSLVEVLAGRSSQICKECPDYDD